MGTWQWGDKRFWAYDAVQGPKDAREAFDASLDGGVTMIDTAEVYGNGTSERLLGRILRDTGRPAFIATKFWPMPYRVSSGALPKALEASLDRLRLDSVDLYQAHFPMPHLRIEPLMERMAEAVHEGKVKQVGVSNYSAKQMRLAHKVLDRHGVALASNQVHYSLIHRSPETNGVMDACHELDVTLIAYSPLGQGVLNGKYGPGRGEVKGIRRFRGLFRKLPEYMPLVEALEEIGTAHGRTAGQVALNWLARQPRVFAIPGARNGKQAAENAASLDFTLTDDQAIRLESLSRKWR